MAIVGREILSGARSGELLHCLCSLFKNHQTIDKLIWAVGVIWRIGLVWNTSKPSSVCTNCRPRLIPPRLQVPVRDTMTSKLHTSSIPSLFMPRDFSSPGIGGLCNSSRPPSMKNVATLDISRTGTGLGGLTSRPKQIRYTMVPPRHFQATVNISRTATVLSSRPQSRCQTLRRYSLCLVPAAAIFTKDRSWTGRCIS